MKILLLAALAVAGVVGVMAGDVPAPEGMVARQVMIVEYHDGPNAEAFTQYLQGHLDYLRVQMKAGKILHAGPFEKISGGIAIYTVTDPRELDVLVNADPLMANKVVTYSMRLWRMCSPATQPQAGRRDRVGASPGARARPLVSIGTVAAG